MDTYEVMRNVISKYRTIVLPLIEKQNYCDAITSMGNLVWAMNGRRDDIILRFSGIGDELGFECVLVANLLNGSLETEDLQGIRRYQKRFEGLLERVESSLPPVQTPEPV
ncbi:MAG TPA: hypothetical protein VJJ21_04685 [Candidatus Nanoarchaeia archaeon]|nr:hypothetical protein [Candidatus Nanoarchaeia archaeon]